MHVPWVDPVTRAPLEMRDDALVPRGGSEPVARIVGGIPRFVPLENTYAESFGFQWKRWAHARSDLRNPGHKLRNTIMERTHFGEYELEGKTILECGMGGGDDTEVLLTLPFAEVHAFDLSTAVERAAQYLHDERLHIAQASIFEMPYPDAAFDVVYCHRVLQHTPDPERALRAICRKVKPGGLLFAHAYKRSAWQMSEWRYKYRWAAKRLPWELVYRYVDTAGPFLHRAVRRLHKTRLGSEVAHRLVPFYYVEAGRMPGLSDAQILEMEQHVTFDALTPWHDHPMSSEMFRGTIESEGFDIRHLNDPETTPIYCTAVRRA
jgi:ubiquinone/menaquinone biosynthesis C-methylase UbiE